MSNPATRMNAFDAMPTEERDLANEYGVNVVQFYRGVGACGEHLKAACERHRVNRQREALVSVNMRAMAKAITRKGVNYTVQQILTEKLLREHQNQIQATAAIKTEEAIEAARLDDLANPLPPSAPRKPKSILARMFG